MIKSLAIENSRVAFLGGSGVKRLTCSIDRYMGT